MGNSGGLLQAVGLSWGSLERRITGEGGMTARIRPPEWALCLVTEGRDNRLKSPQTAFMNVLFMRRSLCVTGTYWHYKQEIVGFLQQATRGSETPESGPCSLHNSALRLYGGGLLTGCKHIKYWTLQIFCQVTGGNSFM